MDDPIYQLTVVTALLALPLWGLLGLRDQPWLRLAGMAFTPAAVAVAVTLIWILPKS